MNKQQEEAIRTQIREKEDKIKSLKTCIKLNEVAKERSLDSIQAVEKVIYDYEKKLRIVEEELDELKEGISTKK